MPGTLPQIDRREGHPHAVLVSPGRIAGTVASAAWRAVAAALSGLVLVGGISLLLWAVTPGSGSDATGMLRGGVATFAAAHFLPIRIGGVAVTIHPLLLTVIAVAVISSAAGRAGMVRGRTLEALHASVFAVGYAVAVDVIVALAASPGSAEPGLLAPLCLAAVGSLIGLACHRTAWNRWWRRWAEPWLRTALRASALAVCLLLAAGALVVTFGLITSLPDATAVGRLSGGSAGAGLGLLLLGLAFLPNAVVAGVGYVSGTGFSLGAGSYSPLGVHATELPAIPLLTAAPDGAASHASLLVFAAPLAAGLLIAAVSCRALDTRRDRLAAAAAAAVGAGVAVALLAAAAGGGVAGGPWADTGVRPLLAGGVVAATLLVIAGAWSGVAGLRAVAWAPAVPEADGGDGAADGGDGAAGGGDESDGAESDAVEDDAVESGAVEDDAAESDEAAGDAVEGDAVESGAVELDAAAETDGVGDDDSDGGETGDAGTPDTDGGDTDGGDTDGGDTDRDDADDADGEIGDDPFDPAGSRADPAAEDRPFPRDPAGDAEDPGAHTTADSADPAAGPDVEDERMPDAG